MWSIFHCYAKTKTKADVLYQRLSVYIAFITKQEAHVTFIGYRKIVHVYMYVKQKGMHIVSEK